MTEEVIHETRRVVYHPSNSGTGSEISGQRTDLSRRSNGAGFRGDASGGVTPDEAPEALLPIEICLTRLKEGNIRTSIVRKNIYLHMHMTPFRRIRARTLPDVGVSPDSRVRPDPNNRPTRPEARSKK